MNYQNSIENEEVAEAKAVFERDQPTLENIAQRIATFEVTDESPCLMKENDKGICHCLFPVLNSFRDELLPICNWGTIGIDRDKITLMWGFVKIDWMINNE